MDVGEEGEFLAALFSVISPKELVRQLPDFRAARFDVVW